MGAFLSGIKPELKGLPIRHISFSFYALEGFCLTVYNHLPDHIAAQAYNNVATKFGWGGCDQSPCVELGSDGLVGVGASAYKKNEGYFRPALVLFFMGLVLRAVAALLLIYTKRNRQVKPTVYSMIMGETRQPPSSLGAADHDGLHPHIEGNEGDDLDGEGNEAVAGGGVTPSQEVAVFFSNPIRAAAV